MPIEPDDTQLADVAARADADGDGPLVMLNFNRYVPGGHEAYMRYGVVAAKTVQRLGGTILWASGDAKTIIGDDGDTYDEVIAVWYPSWAALNALLTDPDLLAAAEEHRAGALEKATVIAVPSHGQTPLLPPA